jgi:eukaryotic-like serine/threonine-protein kinase
MPPLTMEPARWNLISDMLLDALELPAGERRAFVDRMCVGPDGEPDVESREELLRLLAAHEEADSSGALLSPFSDNPETRDAPSEEPTRVGPWLTGRLLGSGGMGAVYAAERVDGSYRQQVAVKLIHPSARRAFGERFRYERQILARLDHPGIARIIDGGISEDGQPYLAMEFVAGEPITRFCDQNGLDVDERIELFRHVCEAVAYAHQNLVVHRDIKPSNILVARDETGRPRPKLVDFGIAKLVDPDTPATDDDAPLTGSGMLLMTPEYAAPEQVSAGTITTATDVYALGVVLYELLAGRRPYAFASRAPAAVAEVVCRTIPTRPSTAVSERTGQPPAGPAPDRLARRLRGDLDTIVMKALRKEPGRRYASAAELAEDLRRYASGLPVSARPDTAAYRARKFASRHRIAVIAVAAVLLVLVAGLGTALSQARVAAMERDRAERRFDIARETARTLLYDVDDALAAVPGTVEAREALVRRSLDYLDRLSREAGPDHSLRLDIAHAYLRAGNVLGNPGQGANLGLIEDAVESYRRGLALLPTSAPLAPAGADDLSLETMWVRALLYEKTAITEAYRGRPDSAVAYLRRALPLYEAYAEAGTGRHPGARAVAITHLHLGDFVGHPDHPNAGDPAAAWTHYDTMLALLEPLWIAGDPQAPRLTGIAFERRGTLLRYVGDLDGALEAYRRSHDIRAALAEDEAATPAVIRDAGIAREKIGLMHLDRGEPDQALAALQAALEVYRELADADPADVQARHTLAVGHLHLGNVYSRPGGGMRPDAVQASTHYRLALELLTPGPGEDATNVHVRNLRQRAVEGLAELG